MADYSYLKVVGGYVTLGMVGVLVYVISTSKTKKRVTTTQAKTTKPSQAEPRKEDRKKKQRVQNFESAKDAKPKAEPTTDNGWLSNVNDPADDDKANREFAKQLAKAKEGTKFATKSEGRKQREKSVKQSRASQIDKTEMNSAKAQDEKTDDVPAPAPASTTSGDADDDQSPAVSPAPGPVDSSGVADMLEPAPSGPSILRLTDTAPKNQQQKKAAKAPEPAETKKQRQNRKKAEAAKAARQEAEQERKTLEEKQRRAARIAEGRAAKDGSKYVATNGAGSAWNKGAPPVSSGAAVAAPAQEYHAPLDTFEASTETAKTTSTAPKNEPVATKADDAWMSSLPSEEEQMELLKKEADEWSTVKTKSSKKAAKKASFSSDEPAATRPSMEPKQSSSTVVPKGKTAPANKQFGSFTALTANDDEDNDAEVEWEV